MSAVSSYEKPQKLLGIRVSALVEIALFLIILTFFNKWLGDGNRFVDNPLHPFWIIILLVTVQYGTVEGIVATLLCPLSDY